MCKTLREGSTEFVSTSQQHTVSGWFLGILMATALTGCKSDDALEQFDFYRSTPDVSDSSVLQSDFFTCADYDPVRKSFSEPRPVFGPEDPILITVARLAENEQRTALVLEVIAPDGKVVEQERRRYRSKSTVAVRFSCPKLIKSGGYGKWRVNFYGDTLPIGYAEFYLLENPEDGIPEEDESLAPDVGPTGDYILK